MPSSTRSLPLLLCCALLMSAGCKRSAPSESAGSSSAAQEPITQIDPATAGSIEGTVHLTGKPPERIEIDMAQDPACAMSPYGKNLTEGVVSNSGKLANVYVYVKDGLGNKVYAAPTEAAVLDQKGCRYVPHVLAAMVGQPVEFRNSDPTMHNVHMQPTVGGNQQFDISQPPNGGTTRHAFAKPELMIPVRCNNHPWMEAFLNVAPNPFFAVTGEDGHFAIHGLPPGTYTVVAVQEQLGQQQATAAVTTHGTANADFSFKAK
ncbi:MAG: carboxypeptidase regulatory-like domain-containing protein [Acidobacteriaceae bacterium]